MRDLHRHPLPDGVSLRQATAADVPAIIALVKEVTGEVYGHLFADGTPPVPEDSDLWLPTLLALNGVGLVGIGLVEADCVEDLWIRKRWRSGGVGAALLAELEHIIAQAGHAQARLRVFAENAGARRFYARHGWREIKSYPHETLDADVVEMIKNFSASD